MERAIHTHLATLWKASPRQQLYQYVLFAAEPYETIAFKVQAREVDRSDGRIFVHWDPYARTRSHPPPSPSPRCIGPGWQDAWSHSAGSRGRAVESWAGPVLQGRKVVHDAVLLCAS